MARTDWTTMNAEIRKALSSYHANIDTLKQMHGSYRDNTKSLRNVIATSNKLLARIEMGDTNGIVKSEEEIRNDLADARAKLIPMNKAEMEAEKKVYDLVCAMEAQIPDTLYVSYKGRKADMDTYKECLKVWASSIGVDLQDSTIVRLLTTMGDRNTGKYCAENKALTKKAYKAMLCKEVCTMGNF